MTDISQTLSLLEAVMDNTCTPFFSAHQKATTPMGTNISETKTEVIIRYELPGVSKETIDLQFERNFVKLSVEKSLSEEEGETIVSREFPHKESISRKIKVLVPVDFQKAKASYENGILTLKLPKTEQALASKIPVD